MSVDAATVATGCVDGVFTIRMSRPDKKNALNRAMYAAMTAALVAADRDDAAGAVVLQGVPGAFSAGNDLHDFVAFASGGAPINEIGDFLRALVNFGKPLVAAVNGLAVGIGTTVLMHCDLVYASPDSIFRTPFLDLGLVPEAASSLLAPRLMGHQAAFALLALGETFSAEDAKAARLVYRIVPDEEVEAAAIETARALARKPREAMRIARDLVRGSKREIFQRIEVETRAFEARLRSPEAKAALAAFTTRP